ncbi:MAG: glycerophosphodiester phosphodiesterase family protein [Acidobacteriota bacterium]
MIAHRGASGLAPENTLAAIELAIDLGVDMVEADVTVAREGEPVVIHDETLERTTDGSGRVLDTPLAALRALDAGAWFDDAFAGQRVPTLDEVLALADGRVVLNLEIKTESLRLDPDEVVRTPPPGGVVARLVDTVRRRDLGEAVLVSSFDPRALMQLRTLAPEIRCAALYTPRVHDGLTPSQIAAQAGSCALHLTSSQATPARVEAAHRAGLAVMVYSTRRAPVNDAAAMWPILGRGVDGICTDRPDRFLELLRG